MSVETQARIFEPFFTTKGPASDGARACGVYGIRQHGGMIHVVMPDIGGRAVFDAARVKFPRLRFIFTNEYSPMSAPLEGLAELAVQILHKSYGLTDLARAVRSAVDPVAR